MSRCYVQCAKFYSSTTTNICLTSSFSLSSKTSKTDLLTKWELWFAQNPYFPRPLSNVSLSTSSDGSHTQLTDSKCLRFDSLILMGLQLVIIRWRINIIYPQQPNLKINFRLILNCLLVVCLSKFEVSFASPLLHKGFLILRHLAFDVTMLRVPAGFLQPSSDTFLATGKKRLHESWLWLNRRSNNIAFKVAFIESKHYFVNCDDILAFKLKN